MTHSATNMAQQADETELRFAFGANWADYVRKKFSEERVEISRRHLLGFLKLPDLKGRTLLDIGCGSGLHSLAAWRSGAERVVSFDYDGASVATTRKLHALSGSPPNWLVMQGSVLDRRFMGELPKADIVYSWGVLHHTGNMWEAVTNAALGLGPKGVFYIALYSKDAYVSPPYQYWQDVKRSYNRAHRLKRRWMEWSYAWRDSIRSQLAHGKNPLTHMKEYQRSRGMSYWHDVRDWLGGYPIEFAGNKETELFARERLGLELLHIKAGEGNTEFLFRRIGERNYWDEILAQCPLRLLTGPFAHAGGCAWTVPLPQADCGPAENLMLYEDASPVGWPNATAASIRQWGRGRYRVEGDALLFSTTDNSDPNVSGRIYSFRVGFV